MDDAASPRPDAGQEIPLAGLPTPDPAPVPAKRRLVGAAFSAPMSWPRRRRIGALLVAAAIATTGGVSLAATSDTPTPSASPAENSPDKSVDGKNKLRHHPGAGMGMGPGGVLHGEFIVPDGADSFVTQMIQTGTVDEVTADKLTVESEDGYTHDYALTTDTMVNGARNWSAESRGGIAAGQSVTVMATVTDGTATATRVRAGDVEAAGARGTAKMERFRGGPGAGGAEEKAKRSEMRGNTAVPAPAPPSEAAPQDDVTTPAPTASAGT